MKNTPPRGERSLWSAIIFSALLCAAPIWAQTSSSGTVSGQVTDQQGAVIPAVEVIIVDPTTNIATKTATNQNGRYIFSTSHPANIG